MNQAQDAIRKFSEMMISSKELQRKLTGLARDFEEAHRPPAQDAGEEAFAAYRRQAFEQIIIPTAKEAGFDFSYDDLLEYQKEFSEQADIELSRNELQAVAGGEGIGFFACGVIGFGFGNLGNRDDSCMGIGSGIGACFYSGATV